MLVCTYQIAQSYRKEWKVRVDKGENLQKDTCPKATENHKVIGDKRKTTETPKTGYEIHPEDGGNTSLRNGGNKSPVHTA